MQNKKNVGIKNNSLKALRSRTKFYENSNTSVWNTDK